MGRPLFVRRARGVTPTPLADALDVTAPLQMLDAVTTAYGAGAHGLAGTVVLGGPADALSMVVLPALQPLVDQGLHVTAVSGATRDLVRQVVEGGLDLAVATTPTRARGVLHMPLFAEVLALVAGRRWADRLHDASAADLAAAPLVAYADDLQLVRRYWRTTFGSTPRSARRSSCLICGASSRSSSEAVGGR